MGVKKSRLRRGLVLALTLALVGNGMSGTVLTALAQESEPKVTDVQDASKKPEAEGEQKEKGTQAGQEKEDVKTASEGIEAGQQKDDLKTVSDAAKESEEKKTEEKKPEEKRTKRK